MGRSRHSQAGKEELWEPSLYNKREKSLETLCSKPSLYNKREKSQQYLYFGSHHSTTKDKYLWKLGALEAITL